MENYVLGIDFGTSSVRCVACRAGNGEIAARAAADYPRWARGMYCFSDKEIYRQSPLDHLESLERAVKDCVSGLSPAQRRRIVGIAFDATGSTPVPVDGSGRPLALLEGFQEESDAMFYLWKDHSAIPEAEEINAAFSSGETDYTRHQGQYSSEWFWAKILHCARHAPAVAERAVTFVEHCDWIVAELTGVTFAGEILRSSCAAGHKALFSEQWQGLPSRALLRQLHPLLERTARHYRLPPVPAGSFAGRLSAPWAARLGLPEGIAVAAGSLDSHAGAVGAGITESVMVSSFGTSSVDMMIVRESEAPSCRFTYCGGAAKDSIVPGYLGIESGQAAFGDAFEWLKNFLLWPLSSAPDEKRRGELSAQLIERLSAEAEKRPFFHKVYGLDWLNGRRYPHPDEQVRGLLGGLSLATDPVDVFIALAQASVFGLRRIADSFLDCGFSIQKVIATGGIAQRSPYIMQLTADILQQPVEVPQVKEVTALGTAIYAAVGAGLYPSVSAAQNSMCSRHMLRYDPAPSRRAAADVMYARYREAGRTAGATAALLF